MFSCGSPSRARRRSMLSSDCALARRARHRAPQVVEHALRVGAALALALLLLAQVELLAAGVAVHAVRHERVRRIERALDRDVAVALLALRDVALGEVQVVEDALGIGPQLEQVVVLEEMIVTERGVRDHQRLHGRGVFLHEVGNARRRVDHDLVGEALSPCDRTSPDARNACRTTNACRTAACRSRHRHRASARR